MPRGRTSQKQTWQHPERETRIWHERICHMRPKARQHRLRSREFRTLRGRTRPMLTTSMPESVASGVLSSTVGPAEKRRGNAFGVVLSNRRHDIQRLAFGGAKAGHSDGHWQ